VWNVLLYHFLSDHAKSVCDRGPEGKGIEGRGTEIADYECIASESGLFLAIAFSEMLSPVKRRIIPVKTIH